MANEKKFRMTRQRQIILDELKKNYDHPSACEIYEKVKMVLPNISLGTVYRNLESLTEQGVIKRLDISSGQRRFDAGMSEHHHIRCTECGRVEDVQVDAANGFGDVLSSVKGKSGYRGLGLSVDFFGICPECAEKEHISHKHTV